MLTTSHFNGSERSSSGDERSELIFWRINPVGPLCKSGGLRELARITSFQSSFTSVAWVPAIVPRLFCYHINLKKLILKWS